MTAKFFSKASEALSEPILASVELESQACAYRSLGRRLTDQKIKAMNAFAPPNNPGGRIYMAVTATKIVFFMIKCNFFTSNSFGEVIKEFPRSALAALEIQNTSVYYTIPMKFHDGTYYVLMCNKQQIGAMKHVQGLFYTPPNASQQ